MKIPPLCFAVVLITAMGLNSREAHAQQQGYIPDTTCYYGGGPTGPGIPDPTLWCEMAWNPGGHPSALYGRYYGDVHVVSNPLLRRDWNVGVFDLRTTPQPLVSFLSCSELSTEFVINSNAETGRRGNLRPPYTFVKFYSDFYTERGYIFASTPDC